MAGEQVQSSQQLEKEPASASLEVQSTNLMDRMEASVVNNGEFFLKLGTKKVEKSSADWRALVLKEETEIIPDEAEHQPDLTSPSSAASEGTKESMQYHYIVMTRRGFKEAFMGKDVHDAFVHRLARGNKPIGDEGFSFSPGTNIVAESLIFSNVASEGDRTIRIPLLDLRAGDEVVADIMAKSINEAKRTSEQKQLDLIAKTSSLL